MGFVFVLESARTAANPLCDEVGKIEIKRKLSEWCSLGRVCWYVQKCKVLVVDVGRNRIDTRVDGVDDERTIRNSTIFAV